MSENYLTNNDSENNNNHIRPPFPPVITAQDLIQSNDATRVPNSFIAYRMALVREYKLKNVSCNRSEISSRASRLWKEEPDYIKNTYKNLVKPTFLR
ncbi:hypothetical protein C1645_786735 [Glomus cerebriforme]|uniref:HMG box domain-containing protein n=1 Tax=Glomus cerebriforme TaxID=658196 RepID=A0A397SEZ6_9GLOM|nr:hypothetical protein C1645_786735 [Glomus cerebriforme]